jgi:hypothetical protein
MLALLALLIVTPAVIPAAESPPLNDERPTELLVAAFGTKGDGRSDDGPAIQKAIDAAIATGSVTEVVFEAGKTYRLATRTSDASALHIRAAGLDWKYGMVPAEEGLDSRPTLGDGMVRLGPAS